MKKKRKLAEATEQAFIEMNNPLMLFLLNVSIHMAESAHYGQENNMTLEESQAKTKELMEKIQKEFDKINQHLDSIEANNDQIEANLEYAETILGITPNRTRH